MTQGAAAPAAADEALLQAWCVLVEGLSDATWIVDAQGRRIVADNAAARRCWARPVAACSDSRPRR